MRWFGFRNMLALGFTFPKSDTGQLVFPLNIVALKNGDTIVRWLFGWYGETSIESTGSGLDKMMTPGFVSLAFDPDPGGLPVGSAQAPGGEMIVRETLDWKRSNFTDGTIYGVKYYAGSGTMRDIQAQRQIKNKTVDQVLLSASMRNPDTNIPAIGVLTPDLNIMLWVEMLIDIK